MLKVINIKTKLILIVLFILLLNSFLKEILDVLNIQKAEIYYLLKIFSKIFMLILTLLLIRKSYFPINNKYKIIITSVTIIILYFSLYSLYTKINTTISIGKNLLFLLSCMSVAIFEELFFRVFIFNYLKKIGYKAFKLIIISSLIFGLAHFTNFFNEDYEKFSVINQIVFAFGVGLFLQSIYLRLKSITFCIMIHTLINYYGSYKNRLINYSNLAENINSENLYTFNDFISTFLSLTFIIVVLVFPVSYLLQKNMA